MGEKGRRYFSTIELHISTLLYPYRATPQGLQIRTTKCKIYNLLIKNLSREPRHRGLNPFFIAGMILRIVMLLIGESHVYWGRLCTLGKASIIGRKPCKAGKNLVHLAKSTHREKTALYLGKPCSSQKTRSLGKTLFVGDSLVHWSNPCSLDIQVSIKEVVIHKG